ncbi:MAG: class I SAM-dependent methyltransferase [Candidatus Magnetomorum sp.]|nr:class I SAM-dependent methyltransferase [Candidatus Magnetomorum sp.]
MPYLFNTRDANDFDNWYQQFSNRQIIERENRLMFDMLQPVRGEHVLGIGCGTGQRLFKFLERGLTVTGLDASDAMITAAKNNLGNLVDLHHGNPEDLPFDDNSFNLSVMINTLEFSDNYKRVLEEAARVTKDRMFIGIWNKFAIKDVRIQIKDMFPNISEESIQFYTSGEIKKHLKHTLGKVPIEWKTTGQPGEGSDSMLGQMIEQFSLLQRCPFGTFLGISVILVPSFRLRPLNLKIEKSNEALAGAV